ncbi:hypothetical protein LGMS210922A_09900 [Lactococcus garvieae]|nr:hypothetical protein LGMS210922A_09900 [Lactococcus garvieae]BDW51313.1 hypothetical protein LG21E68_09880 [Lactococcus garvieae]
MTLLGRHASDLPYYTNITKISGDASNLSNLLIAMKNQDLIYMNFDNKK